MNDEISQSLQDTIRQIKKDFFSFRNGIVADGIRKLYRSGTIIYGLTVPQFMEVAKRYEHSLELALALWDESGCRESRLLSLYLIPVEEIKPELAKKMIKNVSSSEEAEFLAFKVLRRLPFANELCTDSYCDVQSTDCSRYCIEMLKKNLSLTK